MGSGNERESEREGRTITQLPNTNKPSHILIKHLKATTILLRLAWVAEAAGAIEDFGEGVEIDCAPHSISILSPMSLRTLSIKSIWVICSQYTAGNYSERYR